MSGGGDYNDRDQSKGVGIYMKQRKTATQKQC